MMVLGVCSNKPRPSVQTGRETKTGASIWGRDVWHIQKSGMSTICGIDCSEWIRLGETEIDWNCCERCKKKAPHNPTDIGEHKP